MKIVIFGGTFNPVHNGHLYIGEEISKQLDYDRILYIPSNIPPHKNYSGSVTPSMRVEMLGLALDGDRFTIEDCEILRGGKSYTVDTVEFLYGKYNIDGKVGLVIGDDLIENFRSWHRWEDLVEMVDLVVVHRTDKERKRCSIPHIYLDNLVLPISSREIRLRVKTGRAFRYLVPESVYSYIKTNKLYSG